MKKLDKKQIPQLIALCVLTAGVAGYLILHLAAPGRVSAQTRVAPSTDAAPLAAGVAGQSAMTAGGVKPGDLKTGDLKTGASGPGTAAPADAASAGDAPPPSPTMHDPFAVGYAAPIAAPTAVKPSAPALPKLPPAKQTASAGAFEPMPVSFPGAPALPPGLSSFPARPAGAASGLPPAPPAPALPQGPAAPLWTVTGVLQGATGKVAILRSGEARRIVRSGDFVDSTYRVTGVTRTSVFLRHGKAFYQLTLGGTKAVPAKPSAAQVKPSAPPAASRRPAVLDSAIIPVYRTARPKAPLTPLHPLGPRLNLARESLSMPHPARHASLARHASPARVATDIALGLRLLDGSVPSQGVSD